MKRGIEVMKWEKIIEVPKPETKKAIKKVNMIKPVKRVRPDVVEDKHLIFLDNLRSSGITNMFGARPYVQKAFKVNVETATEILLYWMQTFGSKDR